MKIQRIYYKFLGLVIYSVMLFLLFACGKPEKENKTQPKDGIKTEYDEEMEVLTNASPKIEKRLPSKTKVVSIRIYPKNVLNPVEELDRVTLPNCGRGNWDTNEVQYNKTKISWKNYTQNLAMILKKDLQFRAYSPNGNNINTNLDGLLTSSGATVSASPSYIEIKLPSKNWPTALSKEELDIELSLNPTKTVINIGNMSEVKRTCRKASSEPSRGVDGGRGGGLHKDLVFSEKSFSGILGYSAQVFEVQYDLEVRFITQY